VAKSKKETLTKEKRAELQQNKKRSIQLLSPKISDKSTGRTEGGGDGGGDEHKKGKRGGGENRKKRRGAGRRAKSVRADVTQHKQPEECGLPYPGGTTGDKKRQNCAHKMGTGQRNSKDNSEKRKKNHKAEKKAW